MDDNYKTSLKILKSLLKESQNDHWANWIEKDIIYWDKNKSTNHHLCAFGGMGSINDIYVADNDQIGIWKNRVFDMTKSLSYYYAKNKTDIAPTNIDFYNHGNGEMYGWKCNNCKHSRLSSSEIDSYLSFKHLPNIIFSLIQNDNLIDILPLSKWINKEDIVNERKALRKILDDSGIDILDKDEWLKECPKCSSKSITNNEWKFNKELDLIYATRNFKISLGKTKANYSEKPGLLKRIKNLL